jgi:hypothetical protein
MLRRLTSKEREKAVDDKKNVDEAAEEQEKARVDLTCEPDQDEEDVITIK